MNQLSKGIDLPAGTEIGKAGSYGNNTGRHTHVEVESWNYNDSNSW
ncbi:MAG: hypothetical protein JXB88_03770 [Spirochaetales bacterium]|nr:hypothetical protein [Spirochaetales bacterium]